MSEQSTPSATAGQW